MEGRRTILLSLSDVELVEPPRRSSLAARLTSLLLFLTGVAIGLSIGIGIATFSPDLVQRCSARVEQLMSRGDDLIARRIPW